MNDVAPWRDFERCYRAASSRDARFDARFDGRFYVAVRSTGIYCRPSCPAITPKRANVEFHPTAAAAQHRGFRACKRCRPDASPGSPDWDVRADVVARAVRLIGDGIVDREGVAGLAARLGYTTRHLSRIVVDELGAGPLALAREQRARTARLLIETTTMSMTDVAFASGFASVRQFNDTVRAAYGASPTELRSSCRNGNGIGGGLVSDGGVTSRALRVRLPARAPFALADVLAFHGARAIAGVESWDGTSLRRSLSLPSGAGSVTVTAEGAAAVRAEFVLDDWRDLAPAVRRVRRWLDLDADPTAVDDVLGADPVLGPSVCATPGLRLPGSVDPFETAVRAVVGQQVSISGARTILGRIVAATGGGAFPSPEVLAAIDPDVLPMPRRRRTALIALAEAVADGRLVLDVGADRDEVEAGLLDIGGIGPWTAAYVRMRGLGDPDVFLPTDLGVVRSLAPYGPVDPERWRPWRSYALHHLWNLPTTPERSVERSVQRKAIR